MGRPIIHIQKIILCPSRQLKFKWNTFLKFMEEECISWLSMPCVLPGTSEGNCSVQSYEPFKIQLLCNIISWEAEGCYRYSTTSSRSFKEKNCKHFSQTQHSCFEFNNLIVWHHDLSFRVAVRSFLVKTLTMFCNNFAMWKYKWVTVPLKSKFCANLELSLS